MSLRTYYSTKVNEASDLWDEKMQNVHRLLAQRNELNAKVRALKEELAQLHEQGSYVGEVSKVMDKKKVLVKVFLFYIILIFCFRFILKANTLWIWTKVLTLLNLQPDVVWLYALIAILFIKYYQIRCVYYLFFFNLSFVIRV